ncbi:hypothetical protein BDV28DRAFT_135787 [Aspergillus coremiiformis]|uniref:Uncharacterized protein n=1 Tax=Aspergillus coremiiformis TaxID=138285 RepID=A0A5N6Z4M3_9EURO|nr:hypothetical protein BDV28DRAFT_135787 [Aspergillus coremiiformis]
MLPSFHLVTLYCMLKCLCSFTLFIFFCYLEKLAGHIMDGDRSVWSRLCDCYWRTIYLGYVDG